MIEEEGALLPCHATWRLKEETNAVYRIYKGEKGAIMNDRNQDKEQEEEVASLLAKAGLSHLYPAFIREKVSSDLVVWLD